MFVFICGDKTINEPVNHKQTKYFEKKNNVSLMGSENMEIPQTAGIFIRLLLSW